VLIANILLSLAPNSLSARIRKTVKTARSAQRAETVKLGYISTTFCIVFSLYEHLPQLFRQFLGIIELAVCSAGRGTCLTSQTGQTFNLLFPFRPKPYTCAYSVNDSRAVFNINYRGVIGRAIIQKRRAWVQLEPEKLVL